MNFLSKFPLVKLVDVAPITTERVSQFNGLRPYVATADVQDGKIVGSIDIDYKNKPSRADISVKANDVTFARMKSTNKVLVISNIEEKHIFSTGFAVCRPTQKILPKYLKYWLVSDIFNEQKDAYCTGATQKAIPNSGIEKIFLPLPSIPEQEQIVHLLDEVEFIQATRTRANARMEQFVPALFQEIFGNIISNEKEWQINKVKDVGEVLLGRQRSPKYQTGKFTRQYIRVANVFEDYLDLSDVLSMDFNEKDYHRFKLEEGDILLNEGQSTELVGRPAMWHNEISDCCFQNTLIRFRADRKKTEPEFALSLFLNYFRSGEFAHISAKTSNVAHLGASRFASMKYPLPPLDLQREFARRVQEARRVQSAQARSEERIEALYQSMLSRAFAGEL